MVARRTQAPPARRAARNSLRRRHRRGRAVRNRERYLNHFRSLTGLQVRQSWGAIVAMDGKRLALLIGALLLAGVSAFMARIDAHGQRARRIGQRRASSRPGRRCSSPSARCRSARSSGRKASATSPGRRTWSRRPIISAATSRSGLAQRRGRPLRGHRRPAAHDRLAGQARRSRLPRRRPRAGDARRDGAGLGAERRRRPRLPGRSHRSGADPGGEGRRRRPAAQDLRDDHPQHARARHRSAHRQSGRRGRQDRGRRLLDRDAGGDAEDRREDRRRADHRHALAVAALDRRQHRRAGARDRRRRGHGAAGRRSEGGKADAAAGRLAADRYRYHFTVGADVSRFQRRTVPAKAASGFAEPPIGAAAAGQRRAASVARPVGPVVRIARGNIVTEVPVGGK